jgi:hypothetical protein
MEKALPAILTRIIDNGVKGGTLGNFAALRWRQANLPTAKKDPNGKPYARQGKDNAESARKRRLKETALEAPAIFLRWIMLEVIRCLKIPRQAKADPIASKSNWLEIF